MIRSADFARWYVTLGRSTLEWLRPYWRQVVLVVAALIVEVGYWSRWRCAC